MHDNKIRFMLKQDVEEPPLKISMNSFLDCQIFYKLYSPPYC